MNATIDLSEQNAAALEAQARAAHMPPERCLAGSWRGRFIAGTPAKRLNSPRGNP